MPLQGGRPTVRTRFSGIKNVFGGLAGNASQSSNTSAAVNPSGIDETDDIMERLTNEELVLTKVRSFLELLICCVGSFS